MARFFFIFFLFTLFSPFIFADQKGDENTDEEVIAPVIELTNTPADQWLKDPVLPSTKVNIRGSSAGGTLLPELGTTLAQPVTDYGKVGGVQQVRGLGRSVDDTGVEAMGVPLNLPQGGGVDLSAFPSFLWSEARYVRGPSPGAYDGLASTGTLSLTPWTAQALKGGTAGARFGGLISNQDLRQYFVGLKPTDDSAVMAGYSDGRLKGVSGSASAHRKFQENAEWHLHLLGTNVKAKTEGSLSFPTPHQTQTTSRVIPVFQLDYRFDPQKVLQTEFYYDWGTIKIEDPDSAFNNSESHSTQYGNESVFRNGPMKFSLSARQRTFELTGFKAPTDTLGNVSMGYEIKSGAHLLEPSVSVNALTALGVHPDASLGYKYTWTEFVSVYSKLATSVKYPTMSDRYFVTTGFIGNSALQPERDWTGILGMRASFSDWGAGLEWFHQRRTNVMLQKTLTTPANTLTMTNQGQAWLNSFTARVQSPMFYQFQGETEASLNHSKVISTGTEFPYLSRTISVARLRLIPLSDPDVLQFAAAFRWVSPFVATTAGDHLPSYGTWNLSGKARVIKWGERGLFVGLECDNLFDRRYQAVKDYPSPGRMVALQVVGEI